MLPPVDAMPKAMDFFVVKYWDTIATLGKNRHPKPIPTVTPCARKNCQ